MAQAVSLALRRFPFEQVFCSLNTVVKPHARANTDLFLALLKARDRYARVTQEVVPWDACNAKHDAAAETCLRLIDKPKEGEPIPSAKARPIPLRSKEEMREDDEVVVDHSAF